MKHRRKVRIILILLVCNLSMIVYVMIARQSSEVSGQDLLETSELEQENTQIAWIKADTDLNKQTTAAIVAKVNHQIVLEIMDGELTDRIEIIGSNGYLQYPEKRETDFVWLPKRAGVFKVNVMSEKGVEKVSRLIEVSDENEEAYYQLEDIQKQEGLEGVKFSTDVFSKPENAEGNEARPIITFSIGEESIWSKTIKTFDITMLERINTDNLLTVGTITEGQDFLLDRGTYFVRATLMDHFSVAAEDFKKVQYTKQPADDHEVVIKSLNHTVKENNNGGKSDCFTVEASCSEGCELVYTFLLSDSIGEARVTEGESGYSINNQFTCPVTKWDYTLTARVKHSQNSETDKENTDNKLMLPNAYEAIASVEVEGEQVEETIQIRHVQIEPVKLQDYYVGQVLNQDNIQTIKEDGEKATVYVNNNNYITVRLEEIGDYYCSAWVIDDGERINLAEVIDDKLLEQEKQFVYYPKSGGSNETAVNPDETHELYIQIVKYDKEGYVDDQITKNYTLEVE